ncbi:hypothetical protein J4417_04365 [Candidatus Woesearchaeota archaeon]|nr:hypothetical protein [Candidatus Woesearchaeota archaeon]
MERMPLFVKIEDYHEVLTLISTLRDKIGDAKQNIDKIHSLKNDEDTELANWGQSLEEIEKKIEVISQHLNEPEEM